MFVKQDPAAMIESLTAKNNWLQATTGVIKKRQRSATIVSGEAAGHLTLHHQCRSVPCCSRRTCDVTGVMKGRLKLSATG